MSHVMDPSASTMPQNFKDICKNVQIAQLSCPCVEWIDWMQKKRKNQWMAAVASPSGSVSSTLEITTGIPAAIERSATVSSNAVPNPTESSSQYRGPTRK